MRPKQRITAATVVASRQYLRRKVRRGSHHGLTIMLSAQAGRQRGILRGRSTMVTVGRPQQEARWPIPESVPMNQPDS